MDQGADVAIGSTTTSAIGFALVVDIRAQHQVLREARETGFVVPNISRAHSKNN